MRFFRVPPEAQAFYVERDGAFVLDVEGAVVKGVRSGSADCAGSQ
jgi:hypothetical protein